MAEETTENFDFVTVEAGDKLPQALTKENWEKVDGSLTAVSLTNVSGATRVAGEVAATGSGIPDQSFAVAGAQGLRSVIGVVQETIANGGTGLIKTAGHVLSVKVDATTQVSDWLQSSGNTDGEAHPSSSSYPPPKGTFAVALTATSGPGSVEAILIPSPTTSDYYQWVDSIQSATYTSTLRAAGASTINTIVNDYDLGEGWTAVVDAGAIVVAPVATTGLPLWTMTTGTSTNNDIGVVLHPATGNGSAANPRMRMSALIVNAALASQSILVGFCETEGDFGDQNNIIAFRVIDDGNVFAVCDDAGTETTVDLGQDASAIGTLEIEVTGVASPVVTFLANGSVVATITTNIPTAVALFAQVGIRTEAMAARILLFSGASVELSQGVA